ncbi:hypothetical protein M408DRAFT_27353 [Serendipita vermifera MAFF 305830]|uniref:Uncharacterized protein n=1 Tax=Serendipita vermifera MAFF 305830 TaxID=933852 RepID=A0A0C3AXW9_SERVB|nr:hypothetical protein M408DRAFT_27353 [Serendipita vermifera MAFF 305830]
MAYKLQEHSIGGSSIASESQISLQVNNLKGNKQPDLSPGGAAISFENGSPQSCISTQTCTRSTHSTQVEVNAELAQPGAPSQTFNKTHNSECDQYIAWNVSWKKYQSRVLEIQPERETELREYGDAIEDLFLFIRPQAHSFIVDLDEVERERVDKANGRIKPERFARNIDEAMEPSNGNGSLHVASKFGVMPGRNALSTLAGKGLVPAYSLTFWKSLAQSIFRMVTFSSFN